jgi:hypothetical protein
MSIDQQHLIENYLQREMTPAEMASFEAELQSNPELMREFQMQSDIINGLKAYRTLELKARLSAIEVSPYWTPFVTGGSGLLKIASGVILAGLIWGIYSFTDKNPNEVVENQEELQPQELVVVDSEKDTAENRSSETNETPNLENKGEQPANQTTSEEAKPVEAKKVYRPQANAPGAQDVQDGDNFTPDNLPKPKEATNLSKPTSIDVQTVETKSARVKYRYYEGKLFLYGKFENNPYEILEINSSKGRRVYMFHMGAYYEIKPTDKVQYIEPVTDQALIEELTILKKTK